jgi:hypothetical protein
MMKIVGVHRVQAPEPCHLIEVEFDAPTPDYDWGKVTQETPGQPRSNWQVPWDERPIDHEGRRWAFFLHYLDSSHPLLTPDGSVSMPQPTELPRHLQDIEYAEP